MKIVSFNARNPWKSDGINSFIHRAGMIYQTITEQAPDVIAFQEIKQNSLELLKRMLPEYIFYGQFRGADYKGEGLYTAVRKDAWEVLAYETFWLSPTPYVAGSRYEIQSDCPRICVVTQLRNKVSGLMMRVFNLHLDHISESARVAGMRCVLDKVSAERKKLPLPTVILGDFNAEPDSEALSMCREYEGGILRDVTENIAGTFHNFGRASKACKIDYIFVTDILSKTHAHTSVWDGCLNGIYLSDHYPVAAEFDC